MRESCSFSPCIIVCSHHSQFDNSLSNHQCGFWFFPPAVKSSLRSSSLLSSLTSSSFFCSCIISSCSLQFLSAFVFSPKFLPSFCLLSLCFPLSSFLHIAPVPSYPNPLVSSFLHSSCFLASSLLSLLSLPLLFFTSPFHKNYRPENESCLQMTSDRMP